MTEYTIRPAEQGDLDYILHSWLTTYKKSPEMQQPCLPHAAYFRHGHLMLEEILSRTSKRGSLYVACDPSAPYVIYGYLCAEAFQYPNLAYIHWVQVKRKQWGQGMATAMIEKFKADFGVRDNQNLLFTFSANILRNRELSRKAGERFNLVYWPWFKYTSMPEGWESASV